MTSNRIALLATAVALGASLMLAWVVLALGLIGSEGDPFDFSYGGVLAIGLGGAVVAGFRPAGMAWTMAAMAAAQAMVTIVALAVGKQDAPATSVLELIGLNGFFIVLFLGSAWLFRRAARRQRLPARPQTG